MVMIDARQVEEIGMSGGTPGRLLNTPKLRPPYRNGGAAFFCAFL